MRVFHSMVFGLTLGHECFLALSDNECTVYAFANTPLLIVMEAIPSENLVSVLEENVSFFVFKGCIFVF